MTENKAQSKNLQDEDLPIRYIGLGDLSPLAENGVKSYEEGKLSFLIRETNPIDVHLRITAANPLEILTDGTGEIEIPSRIWQPSVQKGRKAHLRRFYIPDHGLAETRGVQIGALEGAFYDIYDYVVVPPGMVIGATVEFGGDLNWLLSHDKQFQIAGTRVIPHKTEDDNRPFITKGPEHQLSELLYAREGFGVAGLWRRFPTARELVQNSDGEYMWDQRFHRTHRLRDEQHELGLARMKGIKTRLLDASEEIHSQTEVMEMYGTPILRVTVYETREELVPFNISQVLGYKSINYAKMLVGEDGRCPVSGHLVDLDPSWEDYGSVVGRKNRVGVPPNCSYPIVRFTVAFIPPNPQLGLKEEGVEVDTCPKCFPTICHGLHENSKNEGRMVCPGCQRFWREDHICTKLTGSVYPSIYLPGDSIKILESGKVEYDLTGMNKENVELIEFLNNRE